MISAQPRILKQDLDRAGLFLFCPQDFPRTGYSARDFLTLFAERDEALDVVLMAGLLPERSLAAFCVRWATFVLGEEVRQGRSPNQVFYSVLLALTQFANGGTRELLGASRLALRKVHTHFDFTEGSRYAWTAQQWALYVFIDACSSKARGRAAQTAESCRMYARYAALADNQKGFRGASSGQEAEAQERLRQINDLQAALELRIGEEVEARYVV